MSEKIPGHYWFGTKNAHSIIGSVPGLNKNLDGAIDSTFAPGSTTEQGLYQVSIVPPVMIISWWDRSVDRRHGSNSNFVGYGYLSAEDMLKDAETKFPWVLNRQPKLVPINP